jgi:2-keto-4-pentenoate hydratase
MQLQLALMAERCGRDGGPAGWKLGLGTPAALEALGTTGPLVSFIPAGGQVYDSVRPDPAGWTNPLLEPELAIRVGRPVTATATCAETIEAIGEIMPAFELIDVDRPLREFEQGLAEGLYHKGFVLGEAVSRERLMSGPARARVTRGGSTIASIDLAAPLGSLGRLLLHTVRYLAAFDASIGPGQILLTGSLTDPASLQSDEHWKLELAGTGTVQLITAPSTASILPSTPTGP